MEEILSDMRNFTSGLLDDIAIWRDTIEQLHQSAILLFAQLAKYGMILDTEKSKVFVKKGVFLGFIISKDGIEVDPSKVAAIRNRSMPTTTTEIRGLVNAAGYFRHLIDRYAELSGPLADLTGGG
ncbi:hypothetical protein K3495_g8640 [Podosphaera aphanis]|nr:hypothetical protein K3495_g8640 [Podosphaera aphanis]